MRLIPFLILLVVPIIEIALFILIGGEIGLGWTLLLILVTAIVGTVLLRSQGLATMERIRTETRAGRVPGRELAHGLMLLVAGILLLTPGFFTDTLGFLLFVPQLRDGIIDRTKSKLFTLVPGGAAFGGSPFGGAGPFGGASDGGPFRRGPFGRGRVVDLDPDEYDAGPAEGPTRASRAPEERIER